MGSDVFYKLPDTTEPLGHKSSVVGKDRAEYIIVIVPHMRSPNKMLIDRGAQEYHGRSG